MALISGLMMSMGLIISGMINPKKVIGFLDVFGAFDPTLVFVMAGALAVTIVGYRLASKTGKPVLCESFDLPKKNKIDVLLILGAVLFGAGWGWAGFCPGPALVGLGLCLPKAAIFVLSMLAGMFLAKKLVLPNKVVYF